MPWPHLVAAHHHLQSLRLQPLLGHVRAEGHTHAALQTGRGWRAEGEKREWQGGLRGGDARHAVQSAGPRLWATEGPTTTPLSEALSEKFNIDRAASPPCLAACPAGPVGRSTASRTWGHPAPGGEAQRGVLGAALYSAWTPPPPTKARPTERKLQRRWGGHNAAPMTQERGPDLWRLAVAVVLADLVQAGVALHRRASVRLQARPKGGSRPLISLQYRQWAGQRGKPGAAAWAAASVQNPPDRGWSPQGASPSTLLATAARPLSSLGSNSGAGSVHSLSNTGWEGHAHRAAPLTTSTLPAST